MKYEIRTNSHLFRQYLQNCEPIKVKFYSLKTDLLIGESRIRIPLRLQTFQTIEDSVFVRFSAQICNSRKFHLGDLIITMHLEYLNKGSIKPCAAMNINLKTDAEMEDFHTKEILKIEGTSIQKLPVLSKKESILSYLSGEPMNRYEESHILKEIISTSPAQSIVEALEEKGPKTPEEKLFELIDSLRISVKYIEWTDAGLIEMRYFNKDDDKFLLKCFVVSELLKCDESIRVNTAIMQDYEKSEL